MIKFSLGSLELTPVNCVFISESIENLPKLVEDIVQTSINTGPRGVIRVAQGIQAFIGVGQEWLADLSKVNILFYRLISRHDLPSMVPITLFKLGFGLLAAVH